MEWKIVLLNMLYAGIGSTLTLIAMVIGYKVFNKITPFNTGKELDDGNIAVGIVVGSIFIGLGFAIGLVIALGLT